MKLTCLTSAVGTACRFEESNSLRAWAEYSFTLVSDRLREFGGESADLSLTDADMTVEYASATLAPDPTGVARDRRYGTLVMSSVALQTRFQTELAERDLEFGPILVDMRLRILTHSSRSVLVDATVPVVLSAHVLGVGEFDSSVTVDSVLSTVSRNPVQNRAIAEAIASYCTSAQIRQFRSDVAKLTSAVNVFVTEKSSTLTVYADAFKGTVDELVKTAVAAMKKRVSEIVDDVARAAVTDHNASTGAHGRIRDLFAGRVSMTAFRVHAHDMTMHVSAEEKARWDGWYDRIRLHHSDDSVHVNLEEQLIWDERLLAAWPAHNVAALHVQEGQKDSWNALVDSFYLHTSDADAYPPGAKRLNHVSASDRTAWDAVSPALRTHAADYGDTGHIYPSEREVWDALAQGFADHRADAGLHVTTSNRALWAQMAELVGSHAGDTTGNPHRVTAADISVYTALEFDDLCHATLAAAIDELVATIRADYRQCLVYRGVVQNSYNLPSSLYAKPGYAFIVRNAESWTDASGTTHSGEMIYVMGVDGDWVQTGMSCNVDFSSIASWTDADYVFASQAAFESSDAYSSATTGQLAYDGSRILRKTATGWETVVDGAPTKRLHVPVSDALHGHLTADRAATPTLHWAAFDRIDSELSAAFADIVRTLDRVETAKAEATQLSAHLNTATKSARLVHGDSYAGVVEWKVPDEMLWTYDFIGRIGTIQRNAAGLATGTVVTGNPSGVEEVEDYEALFARTTEAGGNVPSDPVGTKLRIAATSEVIYRSDDGVGHNLYGRNEGAPQIETGGWIVIQLDAPPLHVLDEIAECTRLFPSATPGQAVLLDNTPVFYLKTETGWERHDTTGTKPAWDATDALMPSADVSTRVASASSVWTQKVDQEILNSDLQIALKYKGSLAIDLYESNGASRDETDIIADIESALSGVNYSLGYMYSVTGSPTMYAYVGSTWRRIGLAVNVERLLANVTSVVDGYLETHGANNEAHHGTKWFAAWQAVRESLVAQKVTVLIDDITVAVGASRMLADGYEVDDDGFVVDSAGTRYVDRRGDIQASRWLSPGKTVKPLAWYVGTGWNEAFDVSTGEWTGGEGGAIGTLRSTLMDTFATQGNSIKFEWTKGDAVTETLTGDFGEGVTISDDGYLRDARGEYILDARGERITASYDLAATDFDRRRLRVSWNPLAAVGRGLAWDEAHQWMTMPLYMRDENGVPTDVLRFYDMDGFVPTLTDLVNKTGMTVGEKWWCGAEHTHFTYVGSPDTSRTATTYAALVAESVHRDAGGYYTAYVQGAVVLLDGAYSIARSARWWVSATSEFWTFLGLPSTLATLVDAKSDLIATTRRQAVSAGDRKYVYGDTMYQYTERHQYSTDAGAEKNLYRILAGLTAATVNPISEGTLYYVKPFLLGSSSLGNVLLRFGGFPETDVGNDNAAFDIETWADRVLATGYATTLDDLYAAGWQLVSFVDALPTVGTAQTGVPYCVKSTCAISMFDGSDFESVATAAETLHEFGWDETAVAASDLAAFGWEQSTLTADDVTMFGWTEGSATDHTAPVTKDLAYRFITGVETVDDMTALHALTGMTAGQEVHVASVSSAFSPVTLTADTVDATFAWMPDSYFQVGSAATLTLIEKASSGQAWERNKYTWAQLSPRLSATAVSEAETNNWIFLKTGGPTPDVDGTQRFETSVEEKLQHFVQTPYSPIVMTPNVIATEDMFRSGDYPGEPAPGEYLKWSTTFANSGLTAPSGISQLRMTEIKNWKGESQLGKYMSSPVLISGYNGNDVLILRRTRTVVGEYTIKAVDDGADQVYCRDDGLWFYRGDIVPDTVYSRIAPAVKRFFQRKYGVDVDEMPYYDRKCQADPVSGFLWYHRSLYSADIHKVFSLVMRFQIDNTGLHGTLTSGTDSGPEWFVLDVTDLRPHGYGIIGSRQFGSTAYDWDNVTAGYEPDVMYSRIVDGRYVVHVECSRDNMVVVSAGGGHGLRHAGTGPAGSDNRFSQYYYASGIKTEGGKSWYEGSWNSQRPTWSDSDAMQKWADLDNASTEATRTSKSDGDDASLYGTGTHIFKSSWGKFHFATFSFPNRQLAEPNFVSGLFGIPDTLPSERESLEALITSCVSYQHPVLLVFDPFDGVLRLYVLTDDIEASDTTLRGVRTLDGEYALPGSRPRPARRRLFDRMETQVRLTDSSGKYPADCGIMLFAGSDMDARVWFMRYSHLNFEFDMRAYYSFRRKSLIAKTGQSSHDASDAEFQVGPEETYVPTSFGFDGVSKVVVTSDSYIQYLRINEATRTLEGNPNVQFTYVHPGTGATVTIPELAGLQPIARAGLLDGRAKMWTTSPINAVFGAAAKVNETGDVVKEGEFVSTSYLQEGNLDRFQPAVLNFDGERTDFGGRPLKLRALVLVSPTGRKFKVTMVNGGLQSEPV